MLQQIILKEGTVPGKPSALPPDDSVTFGWFTRQRYVPMRQGKWSPAYRETNGYAIEHYLISRFGDSPLRDLDTFAIQVYGRPSATCRSRNQAPISRQYT